MFLGILTHKDNVSCEIFQDNGYNIKTLFDSVMATLIPDTSRQKSSVINFSSSSKTACEHAETEMIGFKMNVIDTPHIMLGILHAENDISTLLKTAGIDYNMFRENLNSYVAETSHGPHEMPNDMHGMENPNMSPNNQKKTVALDTYGRNLTKLAQEGKIDPVIGRDSEIKRVWQILARRKKSNAILIGGSGVGKTSIVEGLANEIAIDNVPDKMKNKQIYLLDVPSMVAGSKYRGEFEKKLKSVLQECIANKNIILFIDEIHTIIGAGGAEGSMDGANILKPLLSSGELQVIGATTSEEYQKYFEKDNALVRRFQKVVVEQPDFNTTIQILEGLKKHYEKFHNVVYPKDIIKLIVELGSTYLTSQLEPDRSINILDEIGSKLSLETNNNDCPELKLLLEQYDNKLDAKMLALKVEDYTQAGELKKELEIIGDNISVIKKQNSKLNTKVVTSEKVREVFSAISNIPVENVTRDDSHKYLKMAETLKQTIINQDSAVDTIASVIKRKKSGIEQSNKPTVLFFAGPTGTGKSYTAKEMTKFMFNDVNKLVFLNGAEYSESISVSRITGGSPNYIGYGEATDLEIIRNNPYSIILLDECEKMHKSIWQIFLRIFEEGSLKTGNGKLIDFKNCIFILTSNLGSEASSKSRLGFESNSTEQKQTETLNRYEAEIKAYFKPEVYNRLSKVIVFNNLTKNDLQHILELELKPLIKILNEKRIKLSFTVKAKSFILDHNEDKDGKYGARPIKRAIEQHINDKLADIVLEKEGTIKSIKVDANDNELLFTAK